MKPKYTKEQQDKARELLHQIWVEGRSIQSEESCWIDGNWVGDDSKSYLSYITKVLEIASIDFSWEPDENWTSRASRLADALGEQASNKSGDDFFAEHIIVAHITDKPLKHIQIREDGRYLKNFPTDA